MHLLVPPRAALENPCFHRTKRGPTTAKGSSQTQRGGTAKSASALSFHLRIFYNAPYPKVEKPKYIQPQRERRAATVISTQFAAARGSGF